MKIFKEKHKNPTINVQISNQSDNIFPITTFTPTRKAEIYYVYIIIKNVIESHGLYLQPRVIGESYVLQIKRISFGLIY